MLWLETQKMQLLEWTLETARRIYQDETVSLQRRADKLTGVHELSEMILAQIALEMRLEVEEHRGDCACTTKP